MERLVDKWIAFLFIILTTVNKLFGCTHLFKNIYKHIAWYTKVKIVVIVDVHGHMTITNDHWSMTAFGKQNQFCLLGYDTNATRLWLIQYISEWNVFRKNKKIIICYLIRQIMIFITYLYLYYNREHFFNRTTATKVNIP